MKYVSFSKWDSTEVVKEENKPYPEFYHSEKPMAPAWVPLDFSEIADTHCVRPQHRRPKEGGEKVHSCLSYPRSILVTQMPAPTSRMTGSSLRQWLCSHSPSGHVQKCWQRAGSQRSKVTSSQDFRNIQVSGVAVKQTALVAKFRQWGREASWARTLWRGECLPEVLLQAAFPIACKCWKIYWPRLAASYFGVSGFWWSTTGMTRTLRSLTGQNPKEETWGYLSHHLQCESKEHRLVHLGPLFQQT